MDHGSIPELDEKGLRKFGLTIGIIVGGLFGLALPLVLGRAIPVWPWAFLAIFAGWALVAPAALRPVYRTWMRFGLIMNRIMTPFILGLVYILVVTPIGILRRTTGGDAMNRTWDEEADSYRVASTRTAPKDMEKPY